MKKLLLTVVVLCSILGLGFGMKQYKEYQETKTIEELITNHYENKYGDYITVEKIEDTGYQRLIDGSDCYEVTLSSEGGRYTWVETQYID